MFGLKPQTLSSYMVAKCPQCGSAALVRVWTVMESHFDGKREEAVPVAGHYVCDDCNTHLRSTATGVVKVGANVPQTVTGTTGPPPAGPAKVLPIPVKFPRG